MNTIDLVELGRMFNNTWEKPTPLFQDDQHAVYWLGVPEPSAFRCNTYLIVDGQEALLVDPGGRGSFEFVRMRVGQIIPPHKVSGLIVCHQDPDVAASMVDWLTLYPEIRIITSIRTNILLRHYGSRDYSYISINENPVYTFESGKRLKFLEAPFLHFPGAFATWDETSKFLFSGDVWAAIDTEWRLVVEDFCNHIAKMNLFHLDYMASNIATRGFVKSLVPYDINAILPQHGSVIPKKFVHKAMEYLENLVCGLDLIYPRDDNG